MRSWHLKRVQRSTNYSKNPKVNQQRPLQTNLHGKGKLGFLLGKLRNPYKGVAKGWRITMGIYNKFCLSFNWCGFVAPRCKYDAGRKELWLDLPPLLRSVRQPVCGGVEKTVQRQRQEIQHLRREGGENGKACDVERQGGLHLRQEMQRHGRDGRTEAPIAAKRSRDELRVWPRLKARFTTGGIAEIAVPASQLSFVIRDKDGDVLGRASLSRGSTSWAPA